MAIACCGCASATESGAKANTPANAARRACVRALISNTSSSCDPSLTQSNMIAPTRWPIWSPSCPIRPLPHLRPRKSGMGRIFAPTYAVATAGPTRRHMWHGRLRLLRDAEFGYQGAAGRHGPAAIGAETPAGIPGYLCWRLCSPPQPNQKGPLSMTHRIARLRGSLVASVSITALVLGGMVALAQQPPAPAAPKPAAPKAAAPKPAAPAAAQKPAATPPAPAAQAAPPPADMPPLVYSPWTKFCSTPGQNGQDANAPKVCFTGRDARTETGVPVVAAALIEPDGIPKKIFRVTVPSPVQLQYGTRI